MQVLKKTSYIAAIAAIAAGNMLVSASISEAASKKLTGAEIKSLFKGHRFAYTGKSTGWVSYTSSTFKGKDSRNGRFGGKWRVRGNRYCRDFTTGFKECHTVRDNRDGTYSSKGFKFWRK